MIDTYSFERFLELFNVNMDLSLERDSSALGSLFQQIINDMKVSVIDLSYSFKRSHSLLSRVSVETEVEKITWKNSWEKRQLSFLTNYTCCFLSESAFVYFSNEKHEKSKVLFWFSFYFVRNEPDTCCK